MEGGLRALKKYTEDVESGECEINHLWLFYVPKVMNKFFMWSNDEKWAQSSKFQKCIHRSIFILMYLLWILIILRIFQDWDDLPVSRIAEGVAMSMGGHLTFVSFNIFNNHRHLLTNTVQVIDQKYLAISKGCEIWPKLKSIYLLEIKILLVSITFGIGIGCPLIVNTIYTGKLPYDTILPLGTESYTVDWWIEFIYQALVCLFAGVYFSLKEYMLLCPFFYLVQLIRLEKTKILNLCSEPAFDPKSETIKLRSILKEMNSLLELAEQHKKMVSMYLLNLLSLSFMMLSIASISILIESKELGLLQAVGKNFVYPCYTTSLLLCWTFVGDYYSESIMDLQYSLYNFNWMDAPPEMKKLIFMLQLRLTRPNFIEGGPFFIVNLELFGDVLKRTYYLLTILIDYLD